MDIGKKLRQLRELNGMTLEEVASRLGVAKQTLFKYETGIITNIPISKIEELAKIYGVSPSSIMGWEDKPEEVSDTSGLDDDTVILARNAKSLTPEQRKLIRRMIDEFNKNNED